MPKTKTMQENSTFCKVLTNKQNKEHNKRSRPPVELSPTVNSPPSLHKFEDVQSIKTITTKLCDSAAFPTILLTF